MTNSPNIQRRHRSIPRGSGPPHLQIGPRGAAWLLAACLMLAAIVLGIISIIQAGRPDASVASRFAAAWSAGHLPRAASYTDAPNSALSDLKINQAGLDGARVKARVSSSSGATTRLEISWQVGGFGPWAYGTSLRLVSTHGGSKVHWAPDVIHPRLDARTRLGTTVTVPRRGAVLDRDSRPLITERSVIDIALQRSRVRDLRATASEVARLVHVDASALVAALQEAKPGQFVPVITLRESDYSPIESQLAEVPGISVARDLRSLAPSRGFGLALLGSVAPATAEQIARSKGRVTVADEVGQSGLEAAYQSQLGAVATRRIVIRSRATGEVRATLAAHRGHPGRNLHTTLDLKVQRAAEAALGGLRQNAALVAVQPSTGDILGVAQRPQDSTYDRALTGLYPPGSTFKVVSTATLLRSGLTVSQPVECTPTITVSGKSFHNFEGEASGAVPFHTDFAQSCNTAFISLAGRLSRNDLTQVGREFGLGRPLHLGLPAADSKVPPATDAVSQAAMMIGQDRIVVSPLAMAGVAATVAAGRWRSPRLLPSDPRSTADPLPTATVTTLRSLMREVVTNGTGMALAGVPGEPAGKTGTAEFGGGDPPPTHAWFVAYRGDLALAVLVERGSSGGAVAAPIAARFFNALDRP